MKEYIENNASIENNESDNNIENESINQSIEIWQQAVEEKARRQKKYSRLFWCVFCGVLAAIILVRIFFFAPVSVVGESMLPTYESGEILIAKLPRIVNEINIGDVVVVHNSKTGWKSFIKRVEGVPGDVLLIENGKLIRNGEVVEEGFDNIINAGMLEDEMILGDDEYFVLGDNRNNSTDSRFIGAVNKDDIKFVVIGKLWKNPIAN